MNTPKEIAQNYIAIGLAKTKLPVIKMLVLGILAGMFIALAGVGSTVAPATVIGTSFASIGRLFGASVFPVGLAMVLLAGSELFTGNTLIIIPVLEKEVKLVAMLKNWLFVYIGNFIGGLLVAALTVYGGTYSLFGGAAAMNAMSTAVAKVSMSFGDALLRGILCNFLVCIAVWISFAAKDVAGKVIGLFMPIMLFVLCAYEHSIANMYYIPTGIFAKANPDYVAAYAALHGPEGLVSLTSLTWGNMWVNNLIPSTIGNIIGGMVMVGMAYWFIFVRGTKDPAKADVKK